MSARRDDYAEEVEFMLSCDESHHRIAERLGIKPDSLARTLHRNGRTDLARAFWAQAKAARGGAR